MMEAVESGFYLLKLLAALEVLEVMRRVLLCMLEAVERELCLLEVPEAMRVYYSLCWRPWRGSSFCWRRWR